MFGQLRELVLRDDAAEVEQSVKAERLGDRISRLERESIGHIFISEADAMLGFEERTKRHANRQILVPG